MKKIFSISETAKIVNMTAETLRHYDRIGLVHPNKIDEWTGYRYYTEQEIVLLNTVRALRCMDFSLSDIKNVLKLNDIEKIIDFLNQAEQSANKKISELNDVKARIQRAKLYFESKSSDIPKNNDFFLQNIPQRVILLSDHLSTPSLDNLWNYHRHFYTQIGKNKKDDFLFDEMAGIYESNGRSQLFAVCKRYSETENLIVLPAGKYLCAECTDETHEKALQKILDISKNNYSVIPEFIIHMIVISGILRWDYQIQVLIESES